MGNNHNYSFTLKTAAYTISDKGYSDLLYPASFTNILFVVLSVTKTQCFPPITLEITILLLSIYFLTSFLFTFL